ncbi:MAG: hypothetical protein QOJ64_4180 [Acidobacteriota bacterium]|jgi:hypothetical protein|nr:hypothetical protein [Acidobacteriota bacterium]
MSKVIANGSGPADGPMYAMQRANGDWFAFEDHGRLRMPVFGSSDTAMEARARNWGMLLFKPVIFDERALSSLAPSHDKSGNYFWLAGGSSTKLRHGREIDSAQLAQLVHDATEQQPG